MWYWFWKLTADRRLNVVEHEQGKIVDSSGQEGEDAASEIRDEKMAKRMNVFIVAICFVSFAKWFLALFQFGQREDGDEDGAGKGERDATGGPVKLKVKVILVRLLAFHFRSKSQLKWKREKDANRWCRAKTGTKIRFIGSFTASKTGSCVTRVVIKVQCQERERKVEKAFDLKVHLWNF